MSQANVRYSKGYAASGVGACICARHQFMLANGVGDTQVGEKCVLIYSYPTPSKSQPRTARWVNMDYVFVSAMLRHLRVRKLVSYDIACQWCKGLLDRIRDFPSHIQIPLPTGSIMYAIPKLHWASHERKNHSKFSMNYIPGAARTDGEGVERNWWEVQPAANSTKTMGPGGRQGTLEDHWGWLNWRKIVNFGESSVLILHSCQCSCLVAESMRRRYMLARSMAATQSREYADMTNSLEKENVQKWEAEVTAWEADMSLPDPYHIVKTGELLQYTGWIVRNLRCRAGPSESQIKQSIAKEVQASTAQAGHVAQGQVSALGFVTMGLDLQDTQ